MLVLALRHRGALVGVAPLCRFEEEGKRKVMPVGIGLSDYADPLLSPGHAMAAAGAILAHLRRIAPRWDLCDLQPLSGASPLVSAQTPGGLESLVAADETATVLRLPAKYAEFRQRLPGHFRNRLKSAKRKAANLGEVCFELAKAESFARSFKSLLQLRRARWESRGQGETVADGAADSFHKAAALAMLERGELRLHTLRIGGETVAALYGFTHHRRGYLYLSGFDPTFEKISPGLLMIDHAIEEMIREGAVECDFLRGREAYKYQWRAVERPLCSRRLRHGRGLD